MGRLALAALVWLAGCTTPPPSAAAPRRWRHRRTARLRLPPAPTTAASAGQRAKALPAGRCARHHAAYPDSITKGRLPPLLYAIAVVETSSTHPNGNVMSATCACCVPQPRPEVTRACAT